MFKGIKEFNNRRAVGPVTLGVSFSFLLPVTFIANENHIPIFIPVFLWLVFILRTKGVLIDFDNQAVKVYSTFLFIKLGKWRPITDFPFFRFKLIVSGSMLSSKVGEMSVESRRKGLVLFDSVNKNELILKKGKKSELADLANSLKNMGVIEKGNKK